MSIERLTENTGRIFRLMGDEILCIEPGGEPRVLSNDDIRDLAIAPEDQSYLLEGGSFVDGDDYQVYDSEIDLPRSRRRRRKPINLIRLDEALHSQGAHSGRKRTRQREADRSLAIGNRKLTRAEIKRIEKLDRRYPNGPWKDLLYNESPSVEISLRSVSLKGLAKSENLFQEPLDEPVFARLFENQAGMITDLTQKLCGGGADNTQIFYCDRNRSLIPLKSHNVLPTDAYQYSDLLTGFYKAEYYDWWILKSTKLLPITTVKDTKFDEAILTMSLQPCKEVTRIILDSIQSGYAPAYSLIKGARLNIEWVGRDQKADQVTDILKTLYK